MQSINIEELTPKQVIAFLDKYIIGQEQAKKSLAIVLRNRWRRQQVKTELREEITPRNILMIGPTGVGKTEIARRVAKLIKAPFIKVEASKFTEVGYVGRDVESIIRDITEISINLVRKEKLNQVQAAAEEQAFHRVVECMLPGIEQSDIKDTFTKQTDIKQTEAKKVVSKQVDAPKKEASQKEASQKEASIGEVEKKDTASQNQQPGEEQNQLREKFYQKIVSGSLDERLIEIEIREQSTNFVSVEFMPAMGEELDSLRDNFANLFPKKKKSKKFKVKDAIKHFQQEEAEKLIDQENINKQAIERVEEAGIVFIDEIDKIVGKEEHHKGDISGEGVQRDLLPIVEGTSVRTKYGTVKTDFILFIAAGAFHFSKPSDIIPEFQGRFPVRVELDSLSKKDLIRILKEPSNSLIKQSIALLDTEKVKLQFNADAIDLLADIAFQVNEKTINIGARRLHTVIEKLLEEVSFNAPDMKGNRVKITVDYVNKQLKDIYENDDLSRYIL